MEETTQMETPVSKRDWHMSDFHAVTVSPEEPKENKLAVYAAWAETFDADVLGKKFSSPEIMANKIYSLTSKCKLNVLDIACGTGLVAPPFYEQAKTRGIELHLVGLDYSPEMMQVAKKKHMYESFIHADVMETLPIADEQFDFMVAAGLFVDGLCGPAVIPGLVKCLKKGGYALFTVRIQSYENSANHYAKWIKAAGFEVVEETVAHYLGPMDCYYILLKRVQ